MRIGKLDDMVKGWFIGNFHPTLCATDQVEVAIKRYQKGDREPKHYHRIAEEYTVIISGSVRMNGIQYSSGDIVVMEPGEPTDFECLQDETATVVVKIPAANEDKYIV